MKFSATVACIALGFSALVATAQTYSIPRMTSCKLDRAVLPTITDPGFKTLTAPSRRTPLYVLVGTGTQNYTCADQSSTTIPVAIGAKATLYDASCLAQNHPDILRSLPPMILGMADDAESFLRKTLKQHAPTSKLDVGVHYFATPSIPVFKFKDGSKFVGVRRESAPAPPNSKKGKNGAVDWLRIGAIEGTIGGFVDVYRVVTAGGKAPATCQGQPKNIQVRYATEYWFY